LRGFDSIAKGKKLMKEIAKILKDLKDGNIPKFFNERELEMFVLGVLKGKYGNKKKITPQVVSYSKRKIIQPDIVVDDELAIELKSLRTTSDFERAIGQIKKYEESFPYRILLIYDPSGKSFKIDKKEFSNVELVVWN
jgi:hypothetical protein